MHGLWSDKVSYVQNWRGHLVKHAHYRIVAYSSLGSYCWLRILINATISRHISAFGYGDHCIFDCDRGLKSMGKAEQGSL